MTYPTSSDVSAGQPTASAHYNNLRADALRFGEPAADAATLADLFSRYEHNLRMEYLATHKIRIPGSVTAPVGIVINGIPLRSSANVDLAAGDVPSGAAGTFYVFAVATAGSTTFTIDTSTSATEAEDQRLIGSFYWNGSAIVQDSIQTEYSSFLEAVIPIVRQHIVQGRLTLTSGTPVTTADASGGTIYFTPYKGNKVSLYSAGRADWIIHAFTELSASLAGIAIDKNVDVFLYDNAGTLTLNLVEWSNDTTRATALTVQDGVYVKNGALGYLYLGTLRTSASGTAADSVIQRFVWNYYNRITRQIYRTEDTDHTYALADPRKWNNAALTDVGFVVGVLEDSVLVTAWAEFGVDTAEQALVFVGKNTALDSYLCTMYTEDWIVSSASMAEMPRLGYNLYYLVEIGNETDDGGSYDEGKISITLQA